MEYYVAKEIVKMALELKFLERFDRKELNKYEHKFYNRKGYYIIKVKLPSFVNSNEIVDKLLIDKENIKIQLHAVSKQVIRFNLYYPELDFCVAHFIKLKE